MYVITYPERQETITDATSVKEILFFCLLFFPGTLIIGSNNNGNCTPSNKANIPETPYEPAKMEHIMASKSNNIFC